MTFVADNAVTTTDLNLTLVVIALGLFSHTVCGETSVALCHRIRTVNAAK